MKQLSINLFTLLAAIVFSTGLHAMVPAPVLSSEDLIADRVRKTMAAARDGNVTGVQLFVRHFPDFWNYTDEYNRSTLMHKAAGHGQMEVLEFLLSKDPQGISLVAETTDSLRPIDVAQNFNRTDIVRRLTQAHQQLNIPVKRTKRQTKTTARATSQPAVLKAAQAQESKD